MSISSAADLGDTMFLTRLFQLLLGFLKFKIDGGNPEKFLNLAAREGITLWNIRRDGTGICANTLISNYRKLLPIAEKAGVRIFVLKRKGLPVRLEKHRRRYGFIVGIVFFFLILWYFSGFVWSVEIAGNSKVETREIQYTLSDLGLQPGIRAGSVDTKKVEQEALILLPDLSWMHINLDGGTAEVKVGERSSRPEIVPENRPCNVRALQTGQIIKIQVHQGTASVKAGDTVLKGGLIASGVITEEKSGITRYVHASANAIAKTKRELSVTVPFKTIEKINTGKVIKKYKLNFIGLEIPFYRNEPTGSFNRTVYKNMFKAGSVQFPVGITTSVFSEYHETPVALSKKQAENKAKMLIAEKEKTELSNAKIIKKNYVEKSDSAGITLKGVYDCEEDIAYEDEFSIN